MNLKTLTSLLYRSINFISYKEKVEKRDFSREKLENDLENTLTSFIEEVAGSGDVYDRSSPTTGPLGYIPPGTDLTGMSWQEIIEAATVTYLLPSFSSFSISGQNTLIEVGENLSGFKDFIWNTINSSNVEPNSLSITDITGATVLATGLADGGNASIDIGTVINTSPISQLYRIEGENTQAGTFDRDYTINSIYPYFFGKVASGGAPAGVNRPVADQVLINSGTKILNNSNGTITINFNSTSDDYLWFAIPSTSTSKSVWYVNALNNGSIGGAVNPGGNLFPDFDLENVDSPTLLWNGVDYKIYISNFQSEITQPMELRNS